MNNKVTKQNIRNKFQSMRKSQTEEEVLRKSEEIYQRLQEISKFRSAKNVLVYLSKKEEVNTEKIIKNLLDSNRPVIVPYIRADEVKLSRLDEDSALKPGRFGILEPSGDSIIPANMSDVDCVIVPGVAFDLKRNRLGFGGGYYDKLLSNTKTLKIGLAFDFQIVSSLPTEAHDVIMDVVITEKRVI